MGYIFLSSTTYGLQFLNKLDIGIKSERTERQTSSLNSNSKEQGQQIEKRMSMLDIYSTV